MTSEVSPDDKRLSVEVFQQFDRWDEAQITAAEEMKDDLLQEFVYSIEVQGRQVTSLSAAGINEAMRRRGGVEIIHIRTEVDDKEIHAIVQVRDLIKKLDVSGTASCEKTKPFAWTLAMNKAERNAFRKLIPQKLIANLIKEYLERKKPKPVGTSITPEIPIPIETDPEVGTKIPAPVSPGPSQPTEISEKQTEKGTSPSPETHIRKSSESSEGSEKSQETSLPSVPVITIWKVPLANDFLPNDTKPPGLMQLPLEHDLRQWGMLNQLQDEISIVPKESLPYDPEKGPVHWFLEGTQGPPVKKGIVRPICEKWNSDPNHSKLQYTPFHEGGFLKAIIITGDTLDFQHVKELLNAAWAFHMILEPDSRPEKREPLNRSHVGTPLP